MARSARWMSRKPMVTEALVLQCAPGPGGVPAERRQGRRWGTELRIALKAILGLEAEALAKG